MQTLSSTNEFRTAYFVWNFTLKNCPFQQLKDSYLHRTQKKEPTPDKAINGLAAKVDNTSLAATEPEPAVQIEVTEHVEEDGDTHTEVREEKTTKQDGDVVEEKKEVTTTTKTTTPTGGKFTFQTKETTTKTTGKKTFMGEFNLIIFI